MSSTGKCPVHNALLPTGTALQTLGFAFMAGGMLALGAFTAPVVFRSFAQEDAGPVMAVIFRRYDIVLLVSLGLVLLGEGLRLASKQVAAKSKMAIVRYILMALLTGGVLFSTLNVNATIERLNKEGFRRDLTAQGREFERAHKLSETFYKVNLLNAVLLILLTPFAGRKPGAASEDA